MRLISSLVVIAALGLAVPCARAQDTFETTSGSTFQGKVLSDDGKSIEIETTAGAKMKLQHEQLTPMTQYNLRLPKTQADGKGQLEMAEWCVAKTLYPQAKIHYRNALKASPEMADDIKAKVVVARTTAANELLARGKSLQAAGKNQEARAALSLLVQELPLEEAAKEATQLLATETTVRKDSALKRPAKPVPGKEPEANVATRADGEPFSEGTRTLFASVIESYHKMLDSTQDGLTKSGSSGKKEFEKALKEGEKIRKDLDKLHAKAGGDAEVAEALALAATKLEEAEVDARINLVTELVMRTSYTEASEVVNTGLSAYPKNPRLLSARVQVAAASSSNGGGDWLN